MSVRLLRSRRSSTREDVSPTVLSDIIPVAEATWRSHVKVAGRIRSVRVQPRVGVPTLECTLVDDTGGITLVFLGRRKMSGITCGRKVVAEGTVGEHHGRLAILNPMYELLGDDLDAAGQ
jgi:RecG-like helicase